MRKLILIAVLSLGSLIGFGQTKLEKYWYFEEYDGIDFSLNKYKLNDRFVDSLEKVINLPDTSWKINVIKVKEKYYYCGYIKSHRVLNTWIYSDIPNKFPSDSFFKEYPKYRVITSKNNYFFFVIEAPEKCLTEKVGIGTSYYKEEVLFHERMITMYRNDIKYRNQDRQDDKVVIEMINKKY